MQCWAAGFAILFSTNTQAVMSTVEPAPIRRWLPEGLHMPGWLQKMVRSIDQSAKRVGTSSLGFGSLLWAELAFRFVRAELFGGVKRFVALPVL